MTLDELFKHGQEAAAHLFKKQGMLHAMWLAETANGQLFPIVIEMPKRDSRESLVTELKDTFKRNRVVRYVAMLESWVVDFPAPAGEAITLDGYKGTLEDHEDRREAVFIQAEDINGEERSGLFYILRPEHAKPTLSPFSQNSNDTPNTGRFARLLKKEEER
jgi:hypothetical protein